MTTAPGNIAEAALATAARLCEAEDICRAQAAFMRRHAAAAELRATSLS